MKFYWNFVVLFFATLAVCQDATKQEQLMRALELLKTMPECAVSLGATYVRTS